MLIMVMPIFRIYFRSELIAMKQMKISTRQKLPTLHAVFVEILVSTTCSSGELLILAVCFGDSGR